MIYTVLNFVLTNVSKRLADVNASPKKRISHLVRQYHRPILLKDSDEILTCVYDVMRAFARAPSVYSLKDVLGSGVREPMLSLKEKFLFT